MPELPEVETIVRDIAPGLTGRRVTSLRLPRPDVLRHVTARRLRARVRGRTVTGVQRRAKHVVCLLSSGDRMVIQPRMTGALLVLGTPPAGEDRRYATLVAGLDDGHWFLVRDVRRLGTITLLDEAGWASYTERIGPEPLAPAFTAARFAERLTGTRQAIKKVLMDQRRLAGVGNIYANEALFLAGVDPSLPADRLGRAAADRLHAAVTGVMAAAVRARGTTVRDYRTGTGEPGGFQQGLLVYDRAGLPCVRCGTPLATTHAIDGRQTTFCWRCQTGA